MNKTRKRRLLPGRLFNEGMDATRQDGMVARAYDLLFPVIAEAPRARQAPRILAAMLGLAGPVAVGTMTGHTGPGLVASLGGLALTGGEKGETFRERARGLIETVAAGTAAMLAGAALSGKGMLAAFCIPAMAGAAGLVGGMSRPLALATTRFILFTLIASNLDVTGAHPIGVALFFFLGASWTAGLSLAFTEISRRIRPAAASPATGEAPRPGPTAAQRFRRWRKSLGQLAGWQYVLRIVPCLAAGQVCEWLWPGHHAYWVSITAIIVSQRDPGAAFSRTLQRAAGTAIGVALTGLLLLGTSSLWTVVVLIAVLAAARPVLREANYTAYAAVMTPLVILLLDFGRDPSWMAVFDRLAATLAGCGLALAFGYPFRAGMSGPARPAAGG